MHHYDVAMKLLGVLVVLAACGDDGTTLQTPDAPKVYMDAPAPDSQYVTCDDGWSFQGLPKPDHCDYRCADSSILGDGQHLSCTGSYTDDVTTRHTQCDSGSNMTPDGLGCCVVAGAPVNGQSSTVVFAMCGI